MSLSPCGIDCEICDYHKSCDGCYVIKGKPFYLKDFGVKICPCMIAQSIRKVISRVPSTLNFLARFLMIGKTQV